MAGHPARPGAAYSAAPPSRTRRWSGPHTPAKRRRARTARARASKRSTRAIVLSSVSSASTVTASIAVSLSPGNQLISALGNAAPAAKTRLSGGRADAGAYPVVPGEVDQAAVPGLQRERDAARSQPARHGGPTARGIDDHIGGEHLSARRAYPGDARRIPPSRANRRSAAATPKRRSRWGVASAASARTRSSVRRREVRRTSSASPGRRARSAIAGGIPATRSSSPTPATSSAA